MLQYFYSVLVQPTKLTRRLGLAWLGLLITAPFRASGVWVSLKKKGNEKGGGVTVFVAEGGCTWRG